MARGPAIFFALDLARTPALAGVMREHALPKDLVDVMRVAAGCPEACGAAVLATREPLSVIRAAAIFYLEEMLFFPGAGSYRNLGVLPGAPKAQMRLHMRWLLQWLHPDHNRDEKSTLLAPLVIAAWRELGRQDRLDGGTASFASSQSSSSPVGRKRSGRQPSVRVPWIVVPFPSAPPTRRRATRFFLFALATVTTFAMIFVPDVWFKWIFIWNTHVVTMATAVTSSGAVHPSILHTTHGTDHPR